MIEISRTGPRQQTKTGARTGKKTGVSSVKSKFDSELGSILESDYAGSIDELMDTLKDQEKRFVDYQSHYELERYKALVKKILKYILESGFKTESLGQSPRDMRLGKAEKTIISRIDENLIRLSEMITKSSDAFHLLKTIEEIRGLIFDLVH